MYLGQLITISPLRSKWCLKHQFSSTDFIFGFYREFVLSGSVVTYALLYDFFFQLIVTPALIRYPSTIRPQVVRPPSLPFTFLPFTSLPFTFRYCHVYFPFSVLTFNCNLFEHSLVHMAYVDLSCVSFQFYSFYMLHGQYFWKQI